jgi:hypothetical protein
MTQKELGNDLKQYFKQIKLLFPIYGKKEKEFLADFMSEASEYIAANPTSGYTQLVSSLGEPKIIVSQYFADADSEYLARQIKTTNLLRIGIIVIIVASVVVAASTTAIRYKSYVNAQQSYIGREIIEIGVIGGEREENERLSFDNHGDFRSLMATVPAFSETSLSPNEPIAEVPRVNYLSDGSRIVTTIDVDSPVFSPLLEASAKTASKTVSYMSSTGTQLWYLRVTGTFTYNGTTSSCTSATVSAAPQVSAWVINSKSASTSGNQAIANTTAKLHVGTTVAQTVDRTATLTCSSTGDLS